MQSFRMRLLLPTRRRLILAACAALAAGPRFARAELPPGLSDALARIEAASGGRLGVAVLGSGVQAAHRADERFPLCSTFKLLAAAAVLARVDAGRERLDRRIRFKAGDLVVYSPVTKEHAGGDGMTLEELCEAAMVASDNTAGNLLLDTLGGPAGLTAYVRSLGDAVTRLDRSEPDLNEALPDDPRDTTSPAAMLSNLRSLVLGDALTPPSKARLTGWLVGNKTGDTRLRAGLPRDWRVGDKTGAGERGTTNDVGVLWPPNRAPVIVAAYLTGTEAPADRRNATIAAVGQAVAEAVAGR
jgi:beta-lactamase class A